MSVAAKREYDKRRYAEKKNKVLAVNKAWAAKNKAKINEYKKQWRQKNAEKRLKWGADWRAKNRGTIRAQHKKYRLKVGSNYLRIKNAQSRARHPGPSRHRHLQKRYGLSLAQYEMKLAEQGGVCAVCGAAPEKARLAVDHDHATGGVRDLLCFHCNTALGHARDSLGVILAMASYLRRWGKS